MTIIASLMTIAMVWRWRSRTPLILMLIAVAGSLTMTTVGKAVVGRVRPPLTDRYRRMSTPSPSRPPTPQQHSDPGMVAYLLLRRLRSQWARVTTVILLPPGQLLVSRVFLGHHWLTRDLRLDARRRMAGPVDHLPSGHGLVRYRYSSSCTAALVPFAALNRVIGHQAKRRVSERRWPIPHGAQLWSQPA